MKLDVSTFYWFLVVLGFFGVAVSTFLVPVGMGLFVKIFRRSSSLDLRSTSQARQVDVLIPAHNEEDNIALTIRSVLESCAKAGVTARILVGADSCSDATARIARQEGAEVFPLSFGSKWRTLATLLLKAENDRVAFVDAGSAWRVDVLEKVWAAWTDDVVGVAPTYHVPRAGLVKRLHWGLEAFFKRWESVIGGPVSVHGATVFYKRIEAIAALKALPGSEGVDTWKNDDVALPMALRVLYPQLKLIYLSEAVVEDQCALRAAGERGRRLRMVQGNLEILTRLLPNMVGPGHRRASLIYARRGARILWAWWFVFISIGVWGLLKLPVTPLLVLLGAVLCMGALGITGIASALLASLVAPALIFPAFAGRIGWKESEKWLKRPPRVQNPVSWAAYVLVITIGWGWAAHMFRPPYSSVSEAVILGWAAITALTTVLLLSLMNFFGPFMVVPRRREILTLSIVLPIPGMVWKIFFFNFYGHDVVRLREVLLAAPLVALFALLFRFFEHYRIFRKGPLVLAAALSPDEFEHLKNYIVVTGFRDKLRLVQWGDIMSRSLVPYSIVYSRSALRDLRADGAVIGSIFSGLPAIELRRMTMQLTGRADIETLDTWFFLQVTGEKSLGLRSYDALKRIYEPFFAAVMLLAALPFLTIIGILVRLTSPGPALYSQWRSGYMGQRFKLLKFRTMRNDAEKAGPQWAGAKDSRVTKLGAFLRKTRLDELPQLWNIVRGDISFVGPRPERPEIVEQLVQSIPVFPLRLVVKPGVSGWAQVNYGYVGSVEESRLKLEYDMYYILHRSLWLDMHIILKTISTFWKGGTGR